MKRDRPQEVEMAVLALLKKGRKSRKAAAAFPGRKNHLLY